MSTFSVFGPLKVEWPGKDGKHPRCPPQGNSKIHFIVAYINYNPAASHTESLQNMETYLMFNQIKLYVSDLKHGFQGSPHLLHNQRFSEILCDMSFALCWIIHAFQEIEDF